MKNKEEYNKHLIKSVENLIYQEIDGEFVFDTGNGCLYPFHLRIIADELDRRNTPLDDELERYFENEK